MRDNKKPWKESWASKMLLNKQIFSFVLLMELLGLCVSDWSLNALSDPKVWT